MESFSSGAMLRGNKMFNIKTSIMNTPTKQDNIEKHRRIFRHIGFVVEKDGSISSITLKRGIGAGLDEVAMEAVKSMPRWNQGKQIGMPVRVPMVVPFSFK